MEKIHTCPFCKKGEVRAIHIKSSIRMRKGPYGGGKQGIIRSEEYFDILDDCPKCGKKLKDIKKEFEGETTKRTHEEKMKSLMEAGFSGKVEHKRDS